MCRRKKLWWGAGGGQPASASETDISVPSLISDTSLLGMECFSPYTRDSKNAWAGDHSVCIFQGWVFLPIPADGSLCFSPGFSLYSSTNSAQSPQPPQPPLWPPNAVIWRRRFWPKQGSFWPSSGFHHSEAGLACVTDSQSPNTALAPAPTCHKSRPLTKWGITPEHGPVLLLPPRPLKKDGAKGALCQSWSEEGPPTTLLLLPRATGWEMFTLIQMLVGGGGAKPNTARCGQVAGVLRGEDWRHCVRPRFGVTTRAALLRHAETGCAGPVSLWAWCPSVWLFWPLYFPLCPPRFSVSLCVSASVSHNFFKDSFSLWGQM